MQRIQKRRAGQRQTQNALIGLLSAVSMTRIGLTQLLPLCGSAAWWLSAACMLPGLCVYGALRLLLRHTHTRTLTDCARKLLGNFGIILIMLTLTLPLLLDGIASLTALITFFTEGIGARGSQFTTDCRAAFICSGMCCLSPPRLSPSTRCSTRTRTASCRSWVKACRRC